MITLERARTTKVTWVSLLGLILVPLLVAAGFLWATWDSTSRLDRVQAAIVNNDEGTTIDGQLVPLGRQLAGGLVTGGSEQSNGGQSNGDQADDEPGNFDWVLTDAEDAQGGLESGSYAAVVTIPEDFSRRATSFSKSKAEDIEPATIDVQTSQVRGIADGVIAQAITAAARDALNTELTRNYLDNIYLGFNSTKEQFDTIASAARKLANGSADLADGLDRTATGTQDLADGLDQLDDGTQQLATGTGKLSTGADQLATGTRQLADGTKTLPKQTRQLADGAQKSADGADDLAGGVKKYVGGVKQLDQQFPAFAKGLGDAADGSKELASGTKQLSNGMTAYAAGSERFSEGFKQYATGMSKASAQLPDKDKIVQVLTDQELKEPEQRCEALIKAQLLRPDQCEPFLMGVGAGAAVARSGLDDQPKQGGKTTPGLLTAAKGLATGADTLATSTAKLATGATTFSAGLTKLDTGADKIEDGLGQLAKNGTTLSTGTKSLAKGLDKLANGTDQLADGLKPLATGLSQTATATRKLATGVEGIASGTTELATATSQSATGAQKLADGVDSLADGQQKLADGSDELATGLEKGAKQVPTYDKAQRTALSTVVATPVTAQSPSSLFADIANTTFLAVLALWLGGLASFVVLRAIPSRVLTSMKPSWRLAAEALLPAAGIAVVQGITLTVVLQNLLELTSYQTAQLLPFTLLAALAFVAVNHALVAWLGGVGRFISVAAVVLSAAAAITDAIPMSLQQLVGTLPMTPALEGTRAIVSGGTGAAGSVGLLLVWLVAGLAAGVLAVARRRMARVPQAIPVQT
ncbi:MAG: YhgE/Pip domain-containing protein [Microlunatus sp.]|nr:YhgE/Pip domain-containing protein [Microlunatus sp.]